MAPKSLLELGHEKRHDMNISEFPWKKGLGIMTMHANDVVLLKGQMILQYT